MVTSFPELPAAVVDADRLRALGSYDILDTENEATFDGIVQLACRLCDAPTALVSLVAGDRQWFKARRGFAAQETDLRSSVCTYALERPDDILIIPDLTADPRTKTNPLVTGSTGIRFYAGAPLVTSEGQVLGSLCVVDTKVRPAGLTKAQQDDLRVLAGQVMSQLELRKAISTREALQKGEAGALKARDALRDTQSRLAALTGGDLSGALDVVVLGAMEAVPAADGGVIELVEGAGLTYSAAVGSLSEHKGMRLALTDSLAGHCAVTRRPQLMVDALSNPHVRQDLVERLNLRSAVAAPILRGGVVLGVLKLQSAKAGAFSERDLEQVQLFAGITTASLATAEAGAELRANDLYWRGLFDRLQEGFVIGEVLRDAAGVINDWRYVEVNPAFGNLVGFGVEDVIGRTIRELIPGVEDEWVTDFAQVVEMQRPTTFTRHAAPLRRWYEGRAFPLEDDRFGVIFLDVTQRVGAETRRVALLSLGDRLRDLTAVGEMTRAASEIVGRTLNATRAGFGQIVGDVEFVDIEPDWTAPGQGSVAGRHRYEDFGNIRAPLQRGEPLVVNEVATDSRTRDDAAMWQGFTINAFVHMPVREKGRTVAVFIVHDANPREWTSEELAFLRNVADRLEAGVARVRAEELQTVLNTELAHRLKNTLAVVQSIASQTLRDVSERSLVATFEQRVLALSRAHDVLMQKSWAAARMRAVMESVLSIQADLDRFAFDGPDMDINPHAALSLSLLLHELATNALKYGALSAEAGKVRVSWRTESGDSPSLVLDWAESGGPAVRVPTNRGGFGSKLIRMGLVGTRSADLRYQEEGLKVEFRAPLSEIAAQLH